MYNKSWIWRNSWNIGELDFVHSSIPNSKVVIGWNWCQLSIDWFERKLRSISPISHLVGYNVLKYQLICTLSSSFFVILKVIQASCRLRGRGSKSASAFLGPWSLSSHAFLSHLSKDNWIFMRWRPYSMVTAGVEWQEPRGSATTVTCPNFGIFKRYEMWKCVIKGF